MSNKIAPEVKELRRKWLRALRSGRYKQGRGVLCRIIDDNRYEYCCLGVLCISLRQPMKKYEYKDNLMKFGKYEVIYCLDDETQEKLEISHNMVDKLMDMNDGGKSFKEIADYLEKIWNMA